MVARAVGVGECVAELHLLRRTEHLLDGARQAGRECRGGGVVGSPQWRAVEDQLIPPAMFAAIREAGPLPVAVPATAEEYLAGRRALLERRMKEVNTKAAAETLEDVRIKGDELTITPLKAITPEAAEDAAERLYAMLPNARITAVLDDVHRWTGFTGAFSCTARTRHWPPTSSSVWCSRRCSGRT